MPGRRRHKRVASAALAIYALQDGRDPYETSEHAEDCDESVWEDEEQQLLVSAEELAERECSACEFQRELWERILEDTGDAGYGVIAFQAMELDEVLKARPWEGKDISAEEWEYLRAVRREYGRWQGQKQHQQRQEAEAARRQTGR